MAEISKSIKQGKNGAKMIAYLQGRINTLKRMTDYLTAQLTGLKDAPKALLT